jgi:hypothetical protein
MTPLPPLLFQGTRRKQVQFSDRYDLNNTADGVLRDASRSYQYLLHFRKVMRLHVALIDTISFKNGHYKPTAVPEPILSPKLTHS